MYSSGEHWYKIDLKQFEEDIRKDEQYKITHTRRLEAMREAENEKEKRERNLYFLKQKLIGLIFVLITVICTIVLKDYILAILTLPVGLIFLLTKKMLWCNKYWLNHNMKNL